MRIGGKFAPNAKAPGARIKKIFTKLEAKIKSNYFPENNVKNKNVYVIFKSVHDMLYDIVIRFQFIVSKE